MNTEYTREEAAIIVRRAFKFASDLANLARQYRSGRGLRKGQEIEPIIDDFLRWNRYGEEALMRYGRPEFRLKLLKLMRFFERAGKPGCDDNE